MIGQPKDDLRICSRVTDGTLLVDLGRKMRVLSSAPAGGGLQVARYILNHQVEADHTSSRSSGAMNRRRKSNEGSSSVALRRVASALGVNEVYVGLMTAVPMTQVVSGCDESHGLQVECFATVGVTNAVRAGGSGGSGFSDGGAQCAGTINVILITNAALATSAMVGAVQVVTESKTGVLRDREVHCWNGQPGATGTGTDAVVIVSALRAEGKRVPYSGTHTAIGDMIGRVVAACVREGLDRPGS